MLDQSVRDSDECVIYRETLRCMKTVGKLLEILCALVVFFFFQAEDGIRDLIVTGVQTCALPICRSARRRHRADRLPAAEERQSPGATHHRDRRLALFGERRPGVGQPRPGAGSKQRSRSADRPARGQRRHAADGAHAVRRRRRADGGPRRLRLPHPIRERHAGHRPGPRGGDLHGHRRRSGDPGHLLRRVRPGRHGWRAVRVALRECRLLHGLPAGDQGLHGRGHRRHRQHPRRDGWGALAWGAGYAPGWPDHVPRSGHLRVPRPHHRAADPAARPVRPAPDGPRMSAQPAPLESAATVHPLKRLWESGPSGWNHALPRPVVLIPFFIFAALVPLGLQYIEDNSSWTDAQFWTLILANCAMYACLAVALNLVVGYAGLLNLGFIAFFGIGSYAY